MFLVCSQLINKMTKEIKLTNSDLVALVDDEDYEELSKFKWKLTPQGYVCREVYIGRVGEELKYKKKRILMHRSVMNMGEYEGIKSLQVDHINRVRHDNRKENLRSCKKSENSKNRSKTKSVTTSIYKGVYWRKGFRGIGGCWVACINCDKSKLELKYGHDEKELAMEYDKAAIFLHKEFASLNFPDHDYSNEMIDYKLPEYKDQTTSKYRGVSWCDSRKLWKSEITINGKYKIVGRFYTEDDALNAYEQVCKFYKLTDRMNFPEKEPKNIIDVEKFDKRQYEHTSSYIGIRFRKKCNKYNPYVMIDGREKSLGYFELEIEAVKFRNKFIIDNNISNTNKLNTVSKIE